MTAAVAVKVLMSLVIVRYVNPSSKIFNQLDGRLEISKTIEIFNFVVTTMVGHPVAARHVIQVHDSAFISAAFSG